MITEEEWRKALNRCARPFVASDVEAALWWRPEEPAAFVEGKVLELLDGLRSALAAYEADDGNAAQAGHELAAAVAKLLPPSTGKLAAPMGAPGLPG